MYIIKKHYEATENNPRFAGNTIDYFYGKGSHLLGINVFPESWEIEPYAFSTLAAAKKALKYTKELCNWESSQGYWVVSAELVKV